MDISGGDRMPVEEYQNQLFEAIESQNEEAFSSLLNDEDFRQNNANLSTPKLSTGLTLMQVAAKQENACFVKELLKVNVNGNEASDEADSPILLAAKLGNFDVLRAFKEHNKSTERNKCTQIDFSVSTKHGAETVLHLVLKRKLLQNDGFETTLKQLFQTLKNMACHSNDDPKKPYKNNTRVIS